MSHKQSCCIFHVVSDCVCSDLSAGVDVYSDWIDACDAVAKEAAGRDDHPQNYTDLIRGSRGRRNSDMQVDRHLVAVTEEGEDEHNFDDD